MIVKTPPMGWNSWNTFGTNINEELIKTTADAMVDNGLLAAGYNYLVIDDCWSLRKRGADNRIVPDPEKFPNGMKAVADYVHSKGLKFGMYSCCGVQTCAGFPASYEYEFIDAKTFAEWGVDFLKYDYCFKPDNQTGAILYRRMGMALANCGRDILFSGCSWGSDHTEDWIKTTGAHMWRSTGDIFDNWVSIKELYEKQIALQPTNGQGCFNDMDMLIVGMHGKGNVARESTCTDDEYRTHFTLWSFFGSPLMIGCDIRDMSDATKKILLNKDVIAINQDPAYRQPFVVKDFEGNKIWCKQLEGGDLAILMVNVLDETRALFFALGDIGLDRSCNVQLKLTDVWTGESLGTTKDYYRENIPAHSCRLIRAKIVNG